MAVQLKLRAAGLAASHVRKGRSAVIRIHTLNQVLHPVVVDVQDCRQAVAEMMLDGEFVSVGCFRIERGRLKKRDVVVKELLVRVGVSKGAAVNKLVNCPA